jgi:hypothetical protein
MQLPGMDTVGSRLSAGSIGFPERGRKGGCRLKIQYSSLGVCSESGSKTKVGAFSPYARRIRLEQGALRRVTITSRSEES